MAKTSMMTRNRNHDDTSSRKRFKNSSRKRFKNHDDASSRKRFKNSSRKRFKNHDDASSRKRFKNSSRKRFKNHDDASSRKRFKNSSRKRFKNHDDASSRKRFKNSSRKRFKNHDDASSRKRFKNSSRKRFKNLDDASSRKRFKNSDNAGVASWSDLNHDVLFIVMMELGVVDFIAFSGVCKLWRSLARSNRNMFMSSKPPMSICRSGDANKKDYLYLEDFEGRQYKTLLPNFSKMTCFGSTCGYMIFFDRKTQDFWLVNPITRHELHFLASPILKIEHAANAILVFSGSISGWVFVLADRYSLKIWFCIAGKRTWNHVSSTFYIHDLYAFNGKIYTIHKNRKLCEPILHPEPKLTLLQMKNVPEPPPFFFLEFVSSGENLYVMEFKYMHDSKNAYKNVFKVHELDFGEMKLVSKTTREYAFFLSKWKNSAAVKPESWSKYMRYHHTFDKSGECMIFADMMWYFPDRCLNVNLID